MKRLIYIAKKLGFLRVKPLQTIDFSLLTGDFSKKNGKNLESNCNHCREKTKTKNYDCVKCGFSKPFWRI